MGGWWIRLFFFAVFIVIVRLAVGHFYPELGGKKIKEAVAEVIPIQRFVPHRDQVPLSNEEYRRIGFPEARPSGSWGKQNLADFHNALESLTYDYRNSYPGADGDYGRNVFSMIVDLEKRYPSFPVAEQGEVVDLIARVHETYRHAHRIERIRYDREISLLRGVHVAMADHFLGKIEGEIEHLKAGVTIVAEVTGRRVDESMLERRIFSDTIRQYSMDSIHPGLFEMRRYIEDRVKETATMSSFRPQAQVLTLRYLERHLASVQKRIGGDYRKWIEKGQRRSSDPELKELYRRVLVTF